MCDQARGARGGEEENSHVPDQMRSDSDGGQIDTAKATDQTANSSKLREEQGQREAE
jgi:hypothetical protein